MAEVTAVTETVEESPRSTILLGVEVMTTAGFPVGMNQSNMASDSADAPSKVPTDDSDVRLKGSSVAQDKQKPYEEDPNEAKKTQESPPTPSPHEYPSYLHTAVYPTLTPQQNSGYYHGYAPQQTPEPASPATQPVVYDMNSFFQLQPGAFHPASAAGSTFLPSSVSLSPARVPMSTVGMATSSMGSIPPASPLFPRVSSGPGLDAHRAPNLPYMSPQLSSYHSVGINSQSSDDGTGTWGGSERNQNSYPGSQLGQMPYGVSAMHRNASGGRAYSFDGAESLLPPAALDDPSNPMYSPYSNSQTSPGGTIFAPSWGYGGPPDLYSQAPASPLQPRPAIGMYPGMQGGVGPGGMVGMSRGVMGSYGPGQFFPASSPGPPIQTTASNKGPDGANLFIFHIPNHFTNLDMYQLFLPYGNLLSVRIMVERDSGRSRGFGFVSYDSPESAALAIKELNGFPIGNKRLKVQHKQIRRQDMNDLQDDFGANMDNSYSRDFPSALPPSGPNATQNLWFEREAPSGDSEVTPDSGVDDGDAPPGDLPDSETNNDEVNEQVSSLANLEALQNALPDIAGKGTTPAVTE